MKEKAFWLLSLIIGASFAMSTLLHLSGYGRFNTPVLVVFLVLTGVFTALAGRFLVPWLLATHLSPRTSAVIALVALVTAGCLYYRAPFKTPFFPRTFELEVSALGEKNPASGGNEVWVRVEHRDGKPAPFEKDRTEAGWEEREGAYLATTHTTARWMVRADKAWTLKLTRHPWSGLAEVRYADQVQKLDLYAPAHSEPLVIDLSTHPPLRKRDVLLRWLGIAGDIVVLSLAFFALLVRAVRGRAAPAEEA